MRAVPVEILPVTLPQFTTAGFGATEGAREGREWRTHIAAALPRVSPSRSSVLDGERICGRSGSARRPRPRESAPASHRHSPDAGTFSYRPLLSLHRRRRRWRRRRRRRRCLPYPKPERNQSRNPHSAGAHRGDGSVATLQLASVSVLASYSGGLRPRVYRVCVYRRG